VREYETRLSVLKILLAGQCKLSLFSLSCCLLLVLRALTSTGAEITIAVCQQMRDDVGRIKPLLLSVQIATYGSLSVFERCV
jgi:hypothetical protein